MTQTQNMNNELWWQTHPNTWVAIFVKHDYFNLPLPEFIIKYIAKYEREIDYFGELTDRADAIRAFLFPLYREVTGRNYDTKLVAI